MFIDQFILLLCKIPTLQTLYKQTLGHIIACKYKTIVWLVLLILFIVGTMQVEQSSYNNLIRYIRKPVFMHQRNSLRNMMK